MFSSYQSIISGRPRPTDFRNSGSSSNEPLSRKKRQDSYLKAVGGLSPDESESESGKQETRTNGGSTTRAWKIRQDSYQQAVEGGGAAGSLQRPRRQDSYQQAMGTLDPATIPGNKPRRQDSYQQAMGMINYRFLTTETNLKALYIFRCFLTTSSVIPFLVTVQIFVYKVLFTIVFFGKRKKTLMKPFPF